MGMAEKKTVLFRVANGATVVPLDKSQGAN